MKVGDWALYIRSPRRPLVTFKSCRRTGQDTRHGRTSHSAQRTALCWTLLLHFFAQLVHGGIEEGLKSQILLIDPLASRRELRPGLFSQLCQPLSGVCQFLSQLLESLFDFVHCDCSSVLTRRPA